MTNLNPRDERGWRVPRKGTKSYEIYHLLVDGWSSGEIIKLYGEDWRKTAIRVHIHRIMKPDTSNMAHKTWIRNNPAKAKAIRIASRNKGLRNKGLLPTDSKYVKKLVKILRITAEEARLTEASILEKEGAKCA